MPSSPRSTTVTITGGQTVSAASQDIGEFAVVALLLPAAFTGTSVSFQVSADGSTFGVLTRPDGATYSVPVAASLAIPVHGGLFQPWRYVKVVSSGAEGADRIVRLVLDLETHGPQPTGSTNSLRDQLVQQRAADSWLTATAAISTGVTATVPAPAAGLFNYITYYSVVLFAGAALTPAATPVLLPITGLTGSPILSFPNAGAQGVIASEQKYEGGAPLKAATAAATVVFTAPVLTGGIWRINIAYFQA